MPLCLIMSLAAEPIVGFSTLPSALVVTLVDWYAWTVHTGLVRVVVIEPAIMPAMMPSEVERPSPVWIVRRLMSCERVSS